MRDYYAVLQVLPDADAEVIAAAYRSLARKYHPDHSPDTAAAQRMRELNEAFEVLGDAERRREYDASRPRHPAPFVPAPPARSRTEEMRRPTRDPAPAVDSASPPKRRGRSTRPVVLSFVWLGCLVGAIAASWAVWNQEMDRPLPVPTQRSSGAATPAAITPLGLPYRAASPAATASPQP
jgi:curved DNA-binding protein CbpA